MEHMYPNVLPATQLASTIAAVAGFAPPAQAQPSVSWLERILRSRLGGDARRVLIFSADAVAAWLVRKYPDTFASVWNRAPLMVPVKTVLPTVTPVDYAAFFSGAAPEVNGVDHAVPPVISAELTQPLLQSDSLIAAAVRAGRKVCVVSCTDGCIGAMLSRSGADFYLIPGDDDESMFRKAMEVVREGAYDFVFLYQLSFDYAMHKAGPESAHALQALDVIVARFEKLCAAAQESWGSGSLLLFHTDHGCHLRADGKGTHGDNIPADTDIFHFWGWL